MNETVWVVFDYDDMVAVAASEARGRQAAEDHASAHIDKGIYGPAAEKRFQWDAKGDLSIFCPRPHPFTHVIEDWHPTGLGVTSQPLLTDEPEPSGVHMSTLCVCGQNQTVVAAPAGNVFIAHLDKAGDPCPGLPLPFPPIAQEAPC